MDQIKEDRLISALTYANWGWSIIPLCWPNDQGNCACPRKPASAGKAPLTTRGVNDSTDQISAIVNWWKQYPHANIGIDLAKSGLFVIGPDSTEYAEKFVELGLPATLTAKSGGGDGHYHYYYRKPEGVSVTRLNRSVEYDIQTQGYMVAPYSQHQSGNHYTWLDPAMVAKMRHGTADLPEPPEWAINLLEDKTSTASKRETPTWQGLTPPTVIDPSTFDPASYSWWTGAVAKMSGEDVDRSSTLFRLGGILARRGFDESTIIRGLQERDINLGYNKYSRRKDGGISSYALIAQKVLANQRNYPQVRRSPVAPNTTGPDDENNPKAPQGQKNPSDDIAKSRLSEYFAHITSAKSYDGPEMRRQLFNTNSLENNTALSSHFQYENPHLYPHKQDHVVWLAYADGEFAKANPWFGDGEFSRNPKVVMAERCMDVGWKWCPDHGPQWKSTAYCGLKSCPRCASKGARDMARVTLPYKEKGEGAYRLVWFSIPVELPEDRLDWEDIIYNQSRRMISLCGHKLQEKLKRRKTSESRIYHRSTSFHLNYPTVTIHQKMVFFESTLGELDKDIENLAVDLGGEVVFDRTTLNGETAVLQMISDSVATLASLDPEGDLSVSDQHELFTSYWLGTKGLRLIRPMDVIDGALKDMPPVERDVCPVDGCENKLIWKSEEQIANLVVDDIPTLVTPGVPRGGPVMPRLFE